MFMKGSREQSGSEKQMLAVDTEQGWAPAWPLQWSVPWQACAVATDTLGFRGLMQLRSNQADLMLILFPCSPNWRLVNWLLESLLLRREGDFPTCDVLF